MGAGDGRRQRNVEIAQQADEVTAPSGSHGSGAKSILQQQVPADNPGKYLAQSGIAIRISRTGYGNHGCKLGITEPGKNTAYASQNKREHNGRAGVQSGSCSRQHKNAGADDGAYAQGDQIGGTQRAPQAVLAGFMGFLQDDLQWFGGKQIGHFSKSLVLRI